jgi:kinesin family protein 18/19
MGTSRCIAKKGSASRLTNHYYRRLEPRPHPNPKTPRAKEIKTHVVPNLGSVERHISDYQSIIDTLQTEVQSLRAKLAPAGDASSGPSFTGSPGAGPHGAAAPRGPGAGAAQSPADAAGKGGAAGAGAGGSGEADTLSWLDALATEINENVEERINLQKALYELEDINVCNKYELQNIQEMLDAGERANGSGPVCWWAGGAKGGREKAGNKKG